MTKKFFDYEIESGQNLVFPKNHFRNLCNLGEIVGFDFEIVEFNKLAYDIYSDSKTGALIYVIGGDEHCHTKNKLRRYQEGIAIFCEEKDKEEIIKKITKIK